MSAVLRIRTRLTTPIPELPELTPLLGKTVDILVSAVPDVEEGKVQPTPTGYDFWHGPSLEEIHQANAARPITSIEQLRGKDVGDSMDGFEEAVDGWRREPWSNEGEV